MGRRSMLLAVAGLVLLHAVPLRAQFRASIGALGVASRLNEKTLDGLNTFTGFVVGIEGTIVAGRFGVDLRYLEGNLSPDIADIQREIADAELLISYRPIRWLAIRTGPHLREPVGSDRGQVAFAKCASRHYREGRQRVAASRSIHACGGSRRIGESEFYGRACARVGRVES